MEIIMNVAQAKATEADQILQPTTTSTSAFAQVVAKWDANALHVRNQLFSDVKILVDTHGYNSATLSFLFRGEPKAVKCMRFRDAVAHAKHLGIDHMLNVQV